MPVEATSTKPESCPERQALTDLFIAALRDIMSLQDAEAQAVREGKGLEGFDLALDTARSTRDRIKRELLHHIQAHGCDTEPGVERSQEFNVHEMPE